MREVYNPHEIAARWQTPRRRADLDDAARPFDNLMEFPCTSGARVITCRSTIRNTARVHAFAAAPWGLRLHSAKVGGVMPLTLPYAHVGQSAYGEASLAHIGDNNAYPHYPVQPCGH